MLTLENIRYAYVQYLYELIGTTLCEIILFLLTVGHRMYSYSIYAATSVHEGPPFNGTFLTNEDSE